MWLLSKVSICCDIVDITTLKLLNSNARKHQQPRIAISIAMARRAIINSHVNVFEVLFYLTMVLIHSHYGNCSKARRNQAAALNKKVHII